MNYTTLKLNDKVSARIVFIGLAHVRVDLWSTSTDTLIERETVGLDVLTDWLTDRLDY